MLILFVGVSLALVAGATLAIQLPPAIDHEARAARIHSQANELVRITSETDELELMAAELHSRVRDGRSKLEHARLATSAQRARIERLAEELDRLQQ
jgi:hypothetical protein